MVDELPSEEEALAEVWADEYEDRLDELEDELPALQDELERISRGENDDE